jgi:hypothetical protein
MLLNLESLCIRWRRLSKELKRKDESGGPHVRLGDLPAAVQKQFVAAAKAVAKLETTISHCKGRV